MRLLEKNEMKKICEFCTAFRPVVYCKADAAHLCLSCDAKVHSANALSSRHLRTLLCDACRYRPSCVRCLDHQMFMCRSCDRSQHGLSSQHQKRAVSSYMGCPSAKDFAALWGFELNELDDNAIQDHSIPSLCGSTNPSAANLTFTGQFRSQGRASSHASGVICSTSSSGGEFGVGSSSEQTETYCEDQHKQDNCFILRQILDLKRLQLTEGSGLFSVVHRQEQNEKSSSLYDLSNKKDESHSQGSQPPQNPGTDLQQASNPLQELKLDPLPSTFTQLENLSSTSTVGVSLAGESFWQCKSPTRCSQLWPLNMLDLGVCEDIVHNDYFNIPDVDLTFRNFEELFGADQDPVRALLDDKNESCFSVDKSDNANAKVMEDASVASSTYIIPSAKMRKTGCPSNQIHAFAGSGNPPRIIRSSYSTMSFTMSRFTAENGGTECLDSRLSPITGEEVSCYSSELEGANMETRENAMMRYKEKKKARMHENQVQYTARKTRSDVRKRIKDQHMKTAGYDSETVNATRSY